MVKRNTQVRSPDISCVSAVSRLVSSPLFDASKKATCAAPPQPPHNHTMDHYRHNNNTNNNTTTTTATTTTTILVTTPRGAAIINNPIIFAYLLAQEAAEEVEAQLPNELLLCEPEEEESPEVEQRVHCAHHREAQHVIPV